MVVVVQVTCQNRERITPKKGAASRLPSIVSSPKSAGQDLLTRRLQRRTYRTTPTPLP